MAWTFTVLGGGQEIGANSYLLSLSGVPLLLDAGLHPKKFGLESLPDYDRIERELEAIFITHAHLDHVGSLPVLNHRHPQAPIFATLPTKDIALRMLHNTVTVMNIFREEKGLAEYPFFGHEDLWPLEREIMGLDYKIVRSSSARGKQIYSDQLHLRGGIQARFLPAGHVLGAGGILFRFTTKMPTANGNGGEGVILVPEALAVGWNQKPKVEVERTGFANFVKVSANLGGRVKWDSRARYYRTVVTA
jgi:Cft2 family RNA processing exonuclease